MLTIGVIAGVLIDRFTLTPSAVPSTVHVGGLVSVTGYKATEVVFAYQRSDASCNTAIAGICLVHFIDNVTSKNTYSLDVPNAELYSITVSYSTGPHSGATCPGSWWLLIDTASSNVTYNLNC